jgi:hypothetical protein
MQAKQIVKELKKGANITVCVKTLSNTLEVYDFEWINRSVSLLSGVVGHTNSGDLVLKQTSELVTINYAEKLIFNLMFSSEVVNSSVSIIY